MKASTVPKRMICIHCGLVVTIHRRANRNRKDGHSKHLWCAVCKKKVKHTELADFENE